MSGPGERRDVVVLRALPGLGDMLCAVPALRALRAAYAGATITLAGLPSARWVPDRLPYCDDLVEFPGHPGLPDVDPDAGAFPAFLEDVQSRRARLAVQAHGSGGVTNPLVALFGAEHVAGFRQTGAYAPDPDHYLEWDPHEHEVLRWLRLLDHLGVPAAGTQLEFPVTDDERAAAAALTGGSPYAVVHAGTNQPDRRWPVERFAAVAQRLAAEGLRPVFTGSAGERDLAARAAERCGGAPVLAAGRTSLGELAAAVQAASVVICADTGVSHLAVAVGTPSVVVFRSSDPRRWAPLDARRHRAAGLDEPLVRRFLECRDRPCRCRERGQDGVPESGVQVDEVVAEALALVSCAGGGAALPDGATRSSRAGRTSRA